MLASIVFQEEQKVRFKNIFCARQLLTKTSSVLIMVNALMNE